MAPKLSGFKSIIQVHLIEKVGLSTGAEPRDASHDTRLTTHGRPGVINSVNPVRLRHSALASPKPTA